EFSHGELDDAVQMELPLGSRRKRIERPAPLFEAREEAKKFEAEDEAEKLEETQELNFSEMVLEKPARENESRASLLREIASRQERAEDTRSPAYNSWRPLRRMLAPSIVVLLFIIFFALSVSANFGPSV